MSPDESRCAKLAAICSGWGGGLHVLPSRFWRDDLSLISFVYPVAHDWDSCHVFVDRFEAWPYAIHEMAHCFAMPFPVKLSGPTEPTGWQFLMACQLDPDAGRDWLTFYRTYGLNLGRDLRTLSDPEIGDVMAWQVQRDRTAGLLDGLSPIPVRRGPGTALPPPFLPEPPSFRPSELWPVDVYSSP